MGEIYQLFDRNEGLSGTLITDIDLRDQRDWLTLRLLDRISTFSASAYGTGQSLPKTERRQCGTSSRPSHSPCSSAVQRNTRCCQCHGPLCSPFFSSPELSNLRCLWLASPFLILCLTEGPGPHFSHTFTTLLAVSEMEKLSTLVLGTRTSGNTLSSKSKKGGNIVVKKVGKK